MAVSTAPSPPLESDAQLLARLRAGDRSALKRLFRRYRSLAYRVAFRLLGREADSLAAVQMGFVRVLRPGSCWHGKSSFRARLLHVVSQAAVERDQNRVAVPGDTPPTGDGLERPPRTSPHAAFRSGDVDCPCFLDEALGRLPEHLRQTLVLHAEGELSYQEIGEVLNMSCASVKSQLRDARHRLLAHLARPIRP